MSTYWIGIDSDMRMAIAEWMRHAIVEFDGLGLARAQDVCNRRRQWYRTNVDSPYVQAGGVARD